MEARIGMILQQFGKGHHHTDLDTYNYVQYHHNTGSLSGLNLTDSTEVTSSTDFSPS